MTLRLSVIGTGYLGATHAACMAELGFEVVGLDVDPAKIDLLRTGAVPFYEPGLDEVLLRNIEAGRLHFTTSHEEVGQFADVHFICVGTPQTAGAQKADMSQVFGSVNSLIPHLRPGALVVGKSTVPVGTASEIEALLAKTAPAGVELAWNPEFLRHPAPRPARRRRTVAARRGPHARGVRTDHRRGRALPRYRLPDG
jgi:UDPglucose 6-dehydrogenase